MLYVSLLPYISFSISSVFPEKRVPNDREKRVKWREERKERKNEAKKSSLLKWKKIVNGWLFASFHSFSFSLYFVCTEYSFFHFRQCMWSSTMCCMFASARSKKKKKYYRKACDTHNTQHTAIMVEEEKNRPIPKNTTTIEKEKV